MQDPPLCRMLRLGAIVLRSSLALMLGAQATLALATPTAGEPFAYFGSAVALSGDTALIGAYREAGQGAAYVFIREGETWRMQARLTAPDGALDDAFGWSVAVDGNTAVIGAYMDDIDGVPNRGSAYVYVRNGTQWTLQQRLLDNSGIANDQFGTAVVVSGNSIVVGVPGKDFPPSFNEGLAYVFARNGQAWSFDGVLRAPFGTSPESQLGTAVAIDASTVLLGAPGQNLGNGADEGAALVYVRNANWALQAQLLPTNATPGDRFGTAVSLSGNSALVGRHRRRHGHHRRLPQAHPRLDRGGRQPGLPPRSFGLVD